MWLENGTCAKKKFSCKTICKFGTEISTDTHYSCVLAGGLKLHLFHMFPRQLFIENLSIQCFFLHTSQLLRISSYFGEEVFYVS